MTAMIACRKIQILFVVFCIVLGQNAWAVQDEAPAQDAPASTEKEVAPENEPVKQKQSAQQEQAITDEQPVPQNTASKLPVACVPACRSGFLCHEGLCISKCNPPCSVGQTCSAEGQCLDTAVYSAPPPQEQALAANLLARHQIREKKRNERLEYRKKLRLTFHAMVSFDEMRNDVSSVSGGLQFGVKRHLTKILAIHGRASLFVGSTNDGYDIPGGEKLISPRGDVAFLLGPFGRFYFGPLGFVHGVIAPSHFEYYDFEDDEWRTMKNRVIGGVGAELGVLIGNHEHIDINLRFKSDIEFYKNITLEFGVGFHIFPGEN